MKIATAGVVVFGVVFGVAYLLMSRSAEVASIQAAQTPAPVEAPARTVPPVPVPVPAPAPVPASPPPVESYDTDHADRPIISWSTPMGQAESIQRIAGGRTLAGVKAQMPDPRRVRFRNLWVVDVLGRYDALAVCGEISAPEPGEETAEFEPFVAAGLSVTRSPTSAIHDRFCDPVLRLVPIRYGDLHS